MNPLKHYRKRKKMTQEKLEELSGISRRMICYYEKSDTPPKYQTALKLCGALGIKPETLMSKYLEESEK